METLKRLCEEFRSKIDTALKQGLFVNDVAFQHFPRACCGDTCYLLAEYLLEHDIETIYVCGTYKEQSHAWLVVKDKNVTMPSPKFFKVSEEMRNILHTYGENVASYSIDVCKYENENLVDGLIIDITADQFGQSSVYIGSMDSFHRKFAFDFAHDCGGVYTDIGEFAEYRLQELYKSIMSL